MFPELLRLENSMECVVRIYRSMLLIKLPGEKTKTIRNKKNTQLEMLREIEEILKSVFMFYKFKKIVLLKALIRKYQS
jgi:hypothetical protein